MVVKTTSTATAAAGEIMAVDHPVDVDKQEKKRNITGAAAGLLLSPRRLHQRLLVTKKNNKNTQNKVEGVNNSSLQQQPEQDDDEDEGDVVLNTTATNTTTTTNSSSSNATKAPAPKVLPARLSSPPPGLLLLRRAFRVAAKKVIMKNKKNNNSNNKDKKKTKNIIVRYGPPAKETAEATAVLDHLPLPAAALPTTTTPPSNIHYVQRQDSFGASTRLTLDTSSILFERVEAARRRRREKQQKYNTNNSLPIYNHDGDIHDESPALCLALGGFIEDLIQGNLLLMGGGGGEDSRSTTIAHTAITAMLKENDKVFDDEDFDKIMASILDDTRDDAAAAAATTRAEEEDVVNELLLQLVENHTMTTTNNNNNNNNKKNTNTTRSIVHPEDDEDDEGSASAFNTTGSASAFNTLTVGGDDDELQTLWTIDRAILAREEHELVQQSLLLRLMCFGLESSSNYQQYHHLLDQQHAAGAGDELDLLLKQLSNEYGDYASSNSDLPRSTDPKSDPSTSLSKVDSSSSKKGDASAAYTEDQNQKIVVRKKSLFQLLGLGLIALLEDDDDDDDDDDTLQKQPYNDPSNISADSVALDAAGGTTVVVADEDNVREDKVASSSSSLLQSVESKNHANNQDLQLVKESFLTLLSSCLVVSDFEDNHEHDNVQPQQQQQLEQQQPVQVVHDVSSFLESPLIVAPSQPQEGQQQIVKHSFLELFTSFCPFKNVDGETLHSTAPTTSVVDGSSSYSQLQKLPHTKSSVDSYSSNKKINKKSSLVSKVVKSLNGEPSTITEPSVVGRPSNEEGEAENDASMCGLHEMQETFKYWLTTTTTSNGQQKIEMGPSAVAPTEVMTTMSPATAEDAIASPHDVTEGVEIEEQDFLCGKFGVQGFEDVCKFFFNPSESRDTQVPLLLGDKASDPASSANLSTKTGQAEEPTAGRKSDAEREERLEPTTTSTRTRKWKKMLTRKENTTGKPRKAGSSRSSRVLSRFRGAAASRSVKAKASI